MAAVLVLNLSVATPILCVRRAGKSAIFDSF
jgi:hypothetical protein